VTPFPCQRCARRSFTIRGQCDACNPALHIAHQEALERYSRHAEAYRRETGREPLSAWCDFERWMESRDEAVA
jgi:predicted ATP-dependent serine protease